MHWRHTRFLPWDSAGALCTGRTKTVGLSERFRSNSDRIRTTQSKSQVSKWVSEVYLLLVSVDQPAGCFAQRRARPQQDLQSEKRTVSYSEGFHLGHAPELEFYTTQAAPESKRRTIHHCRLGPGGDLSSAMACTNLWWG